MKLSISGIIGIDIDDNYRWKDTLYFNNDLASKDDRDYRNCNVYISVKYAKDLVIGDCRDIGNGILIGNNVIIDKEYGVRLERKSDFGYVLTVRQECNEWLIVCVQLALLESGYTLIHAAGLEKNGNVLLLPSWGGVGKTATVIRMINEQGWKLMGDDLILVNSEGVATSFLKPFVIYAYHEPLFPELFKAKNKIVKSKRINNLMSRMIPTVKRVLRTVPGILAFARKHNPQSMRVSPYRIFNNNQLADNGKIKQVIWLERVIEENSLHKLDTSEIASKATAVTIREIFGDRIGAVYDMCGCGMLKYDDLYVKMYEIIKSAFEDAKPLQLNISTSIPIDKVGGIVMENVAKVIKE